ncbi:phosphate signaling complex protein PhoU [Sphingomonas sp. RG327]|uniref:Phosphate-specific transport system accessory protein PhoU n=1 Tax=Sphingomonas anseongensis TaxID=2908207 RepID=A0ABT0RGX0_9SPHN|nr:phosphate signaling complex protein PhoU [Sphingomonas anseongensis]MCL6679524.1 phosphate signaling complex protein PhoU [Sphingomonas anseongensis]
MEQTQGHTLKAFDRDMAELRELITDMGSFAEAAITEAMRCLVERDAAAAAELVEADVQLDDLEAEAERRVVQLIALRAPMADDLRDVIAALKIAGECERIGDYAKNIARRVRRLPKKGEIEPLSLLPEMARIALSMVHDVLAAFVGRDAEGAKTVCARDDALDDFYESIFRTLLTYMMENSQNIGASTTLLFVAKNLERIGDHATNIAETVYFAATGERLVDSVN